MKLKVLTIGLIAAIAISSTSCENPNQTGGAVAGAATGALVGAALGRGRGQGAAIAVGAVLGALIGSEIGRRLDERDRMLYAQQAQYAAAQPVNTVTTWENPQTGNRGTIKPTSAVYRGTGNVSNRNCRNFTETITLKDGRTETINGRRCQNADGSWEFVG
jgi:surface antigen